MTQLMKPAIFEKVKQEAGELLPHLNQLWNKEVVSGKKQSTAKSMAYYANKPGAVVNPEAIDAAAKYFHAWLSKGETELKAVLLALSDGGGYFTAEVSMRVAGAFVAHGGGDEVSMISAAQARGATPIIAPVVCDKGRGVLDSY
jgi:hypothetical protein